MALKVPLSLRISSYEPTWANSSTQLDICQVLKTEGNHTQNSHLYWEMSGNKFWRINDFGMQWGGIPCQGSRTVSGMTHRCWDLPKSLIIGIRWGLQRSDWEGAYKTQWGVRIFSCLWLTVFKDDVSDLPFRTMVTVAMWRIYRIRGKVIRQGGKLPPS